MLIIGFQKVNIKHKLKYNEKHSRIKGLYIKYMVNK